MLSRPLWCALPDFAQGLAGGEASQTGRANGDVSIGFEGKQVLENISLTVSPGETRILLEPAGSANETQQSSRGS
jgi:hypothetical protein